jgi:hypothetical protein
MSATVASMPAKKATKRPRNASSGSRRPPPEAGVDAVQLIAGTLARHEGTIRQLAEVVVNLHANVSALRDVLDALTARTTDPKVTRAKARLERVKLRE